MRLPPPIPIPGIIPPVPNALKTRVQKRAFLRIGSDNALLVPDPFPSGVIAALIRQHPRRAQRGFRWSCDGYKEEREENERQKKERREPMI